MYDFYLWEYDYGHNLNPDAAIKIPGMSYQPPLIGTKQILNMRTTSLPAAGGLVRLLVGLVAVRRLPGRHAGQVQAADCSRASILAAQMKSLSDKPPMEWVLK